MLGQGASLLSAVMLLSPDYRAMAVAPPDAADPFEVVDAGSVEVPSPEGSKWEPPPYAPPAEPGPENAESAGPGSNAPGVSVSSDALQGSSISQAPPTTAPGEAVKPTRKIINAGIALMVLGGASGALSYYTFTRRRDATRQLESQESMNAALAAGGLRPVDTTPIEDDVAKFRTLSIGFGIGAVALAVAGGVVVLVGASRKRNPSMVTWRPTLTGLEVSF